LEALCVAGGKGHIAWEMKGITLGLLKKKEIKKRVVGRGKKIDHLKKNSEPPSRRST